MTRSTPPKHTIFAILSVIESGKAQGDPGAVALLADGAGISYGIHQATDGSGSLDAVLLRYLDLGGQSVAIRDLLPKLATNDSTREDPSNPSPWCRAAMATLRDVGHADPLMLEAQQAVFTDLYWTPAVAQWEAMGLVTPLALALVYDTCIQSGPGGVARMRRLFPEVPPVRGGDEKRWARAYIEARRTWLLSRGGAIAASVYRMDVFRQLVRQRLWDLATPFSVRGQLITEAT